MQSGKKIFLRLPYIIGIDEAGRGPLAGPIVVGGVKMGAEKLDEKLFQGIRDSKKLTPRKREEWYCLLVRHPRIKWAAACVWPRVIDRINIANAANLGAARVYKKLAGEDRCHALLDGGLYLSKNIFHETIIKGDEKIPLISAASIIAKVTRDRIMLRLHKKFPQYEFARHKGYCTKVHRDLVRRYGYSKVHRKSFSFAPDIDNPIKL